MDILNIALPIVYTIVGLALIWFVIELVVTVKKVRGRAISTIDELQPTVKNIEDMVAEIQPTISKVDPLVDRVTLTVDSANLEMMRVDEILEDISQITGTVSKTVNTVDNVTSAPLDIVTSVTNKVRKKFSPNYASAESRMAGGSPSQKVNPIAQFADTAIDAAGEAIKEQQSKSQERKDIQSEKSAVREEKNDRMADRSKRLANKILEDAAIDAPPVSDESEAANPVDSSASDLANDATGSALDAADAFIEEDPQSIEAAAETFDSAESR